MFKAILRLSILFILGLFFISMAHATGTNSCTMSPAGDVVIQDTGTWKLTYTMSATGFSAGGNFRVVIPSDWTLPQKDTPGGYGYVTATTTASGVGLTLGITGSTITVTADAAMSTGTEIFLIYGDTITSSGLGAVPQNYSEDNVEFLVTDDIYNTGTYTTLTEYPIIDVVNFLSGDVSGYINYAGTVSGDLYILVFSTWEPSSMSEAIAKTSYTIAGPLVSYSYFIPEVSTGTERWVAAYIDINGDEEQQDSLGEPAGAYGETTEIDAQSIVVTTAGVIDIDIEMTDPEGKIYGTISYFGEPFVTTHTVVGFWDNEFYSGTPMEQEITSCDGGTYEETYLTEYTTYYVRAWIDENYDNILDAGETYGDGHPNGIYFTPATNYQQDITIYKAPEGSGSINIEPNEMIQGTTGPIKFTYTVPTSSMAVGGGLKISVPNGWTTPQSTNASDYGYLETTTTQAGSTISIDDIQVYSSSTTILVGVSDSDLMPGSRIYVVYGSTSEASNLGTRVQDNPEYNVELDVESDLEGSSIYSVITPTPTVNIIPPYDWGDVKGFIDYTGNVSDTLWIVASNVWPISGEEDVVAKISYSVSGPLEDFYYKLEFISTGSRWISAFIDVDADEWVTDNTDPKGEYTGNPISITHKSITENVNLVLEDPIIEGKISGDIYNTGPSTGPCKITISETEYGPNVPGGMSSLNYATVNDTVPYVSNLISSGTYYIRAFIDFNDDWVKDDNEPFGIYGGTTTPQSVVIDSTITVQGININLNEPETDEASITGVIEHSGQETGSIYVNAWPDFEDKWFLISDYNDKIDLIPGVSTYTFTITGLDEYQNYYVNGFKVLSEDPDYKRFDQYVEYESNPVYVSTYTVNIGTVTLENFQYRILGDINISDNNIDIGDGIQIEAFTDPSMDDSYLYRSTYLSSEGEYDLPALLQGATYYLRAYVDSVPGNGVYDPYEAIGIYDSNSDGSPDPIVMNYDGYEIDLKLEYPTSGEGTITGNINYEESTASGTIRVAYWRDKGMNVAPDSTLDVGVTTENGPSAYEFYGSFNLSGLLQGSYFVAAFIDINNDGIIDEGEPFVPYQYSIWLNEGGYVGGIDINILPPQNIKLRGKVVYSTNTAGAYSGMILTLYDIKNTYATYDDVVVATTTSFSPFSVDAATSYNFEFSNIDLIKNNQYRLKAYASGTYVNPIDLWLYVYQEESTLYVEDMIGLDYAFSASQGLTYSVGNLTVDNDVDVSTYNVSITPNWDNDKDYANLNFDISVQGQNYTGFNYVVYRLIVDTNKDGEFVWFDYSEIEYDTYGNPIYNGNSITWDELNALIAQNGDWYTDGWIYPSYSTTTASVRWEGRDPNWQVVGKGTYDTKLIVLDTWNWVEDYDDHTIFVDSTTLSITVDVPSVEGTIIYYKSDGSSAGIPGAKVILSGSNGWGQSFTNSNGEFVIAGINEGTYWIGVEAKGFTSYQDNIYVPAEGKDLAAIELSKGGLLKGKITLPSVFSAYTDKWGNQINQLWGGVNAWSETSPQNGWTQFTIQEGTDTANYELSLAPGEYKVRVEAEDYVSQVQTVIITETETTLDFALSKSGKIYGVVEIPNPAPQYGLWIDVGAQTSDFKQFSWGGGQILEGDTTGYYELRNVIPGTYNVRFNVFGYASKVIENVTVVTSSDTGTVSLSQGSRITGELTIQGDTSEMTYTDLWINAYSPGSGFGNGTNVTFTTDTVKSTATYTISGLETGSYEIHTWLNGFELENMPIKVSVGQDQTVNKNLTLSQFTGVIQGRVTGYNDWSKVYVTAKLSWWDNNQPPDPVQISSTGDFTIPKLGTGEYILTVNEYDTVPSGWSAGDPTGAFGEVIERVNVANGKITSGVILSLSSGNTISGTITSDAEITVRLSDGTTEAFDLTTSTINLMAIPYKLQWFGMDADKTAQRASFPMVWTTSATYEIKGLADDTYIVKLNGDLNNDGKEDVAPIKSQIYVTGGEVKTYNMNLGKGYRIKGTVTRLNVGDDDYFHIGLYDSSKDNNSELMYKNIKLKKSKDSKPFNLGPVEPGSYIIRVYPSRENYKVAFRSVDVASSNVTGVNMRMEQGATIIGVLVDGETGSPVTGESVKVRCEARPWVEGGWRETRGDDSWWEESWGADPLKISTTTGSFNLPNLSAGTYNVRVENTKSEFGSTKQAKTYVGVLIAGVVVPDKTQDVDLGTIKLFEGVTISGRVGFDDNGNHIIDEGEGLSNIRMKARPSSSHGDTIESEAKTDGKGYYEVEGIDKNIKYWEVVAAERPWWGEGIKVLYGEESKDNVAPKSTDVDFLLERANADLKGKVIAEADEPLIQPFQEGLRGAMIVLSKKGKVYNDPMGGMEIGSEPDGNFYIQGLVPGTYDMKVMAKGLATTTTSVYLIEGVNEMSQAVYLSYGGTVQGTIRDEIDQKITTSLVQEVVAVEKNRFVITIGSIESDPVTKEISGYEVKGLRPGMPYYLAMVQDDGENIIVSSYTVTLSGAQETITRNLVYKDEAPSFIIQIGRDTSNDKKFLISIFATETLLEAEATDIITKVSGKASGTLPVDEMIYPQSKDELKAYYYLDAAGADLSRGYFTLNLTGHDLEGQETTLNIEIRVGMKAKNEGIISPLLGGQVKLGDGDVTSIFVPGGAVDTDNPNSIKTIIIKIDASEVGISGLAKRPSYAYPFKIPKPRLASGEDMSIQSGYYDIELREYAQSVLGANLNLAADKTASVTIQYDTNTVTAVLEGNLDIAYYDETNGLWIKEKNSRVVDSSKGTISVDVSHLSKFAAFTDTTPPEVPANLKTKTKGRDWIEMEWDEVLTNDLVGFNIYRSSISVDSYFVQISTASKDTLLFTDTGLDFEQIYYYRLTSYDDSTTPNESQKSQVLSWTGAYQGPFITYIWPSPYNPTKGNANFRYKVPGDGTNNLKVSLTIYNVAGELVRTLLDEYPVTDGILELTEWDGTNDSGQRLASGVYIYIFKAGDYKEIKKFAVIK